MSFICGIRLNTEQVSLGPLVITFVIPRYFWSVFHKLPSQDVMKREPCADEAATTKSSGDLLLPFLLPEFIFSEQCSSVVSTARRILGPSLRPAVCERAIWGLIVNSCENLPGQNRQLGQCYSAISSALTGIIDTLDIASGRSETQHESPRVDDCVLSDSSLIPPLCFMIGKNFSSDQLRRWMSLNTTKGWQPPKYYWGLMEAEEIMAVLRKLYGIHRSNEFLGALLQDYDNRKSSRCNSAQRSWNGQISEVTGNFNLFSKLCAQLVCEFLSSDDNFEFGDKDPNNICKLFCHAENAYCYAQALFHFIPIFRPDFSGLIRLGQILSNNLKLSKVSYSEGPLAHDLSTLCSALANFPFLSAAFSKAVHLTANGEIRFETSELGNWRDALREVLRRFEDPASVWVLRAVAKQPAVCVLENKKKSDRTDKCLRISKYCQMLCESSRGDTFFPSQTGSDIMDSICSSSAAGRCPSAREWIANEKPSSESGDSVSSSVDCEYLSCSDVEPTVPPVISRTGLVIVDDKQTRPGEVRMSTEELLNLATVTSDKPAVIGSEMTGEQKKEHPRTIHSVQWVPEIEMKQKLKLQNYWNLPSASQVGDVDAQKDEKMNERYRRAGGTSVVLPPMEALRDIMVLEGLFDSAVNSEENLAASVVDMEIIVDLILMLTIHSAYELVIQQHESSLIGNAMLTEDEVLPARDDLIISAEPGRFHGRGKMIPRKRVYQQGSMSDGDDGASLDGLCGKKQKLGADDLYYSDQHRNRLKSQRPYVTEKLDGLSDASTICFNCHTESKLFAAQLASPGLAELLSSKMKLYGAIAEDYKSLSRYDLRAIVKITGTKYKHPAAMINDLLMHCTTSAGAVAFLRFVRQLVLNSGLAVRRRFLLAGENPAALASASLLSALVKISHWHPRKRILVLALLVNILRESHRSAIPADSACLKRRRAILAAIVLHCTLSPRTSSSGSKRVSSATNGGATSDSETPTDDTAELSEPLRCIGDQGEYGITTVTRALASVVDVIDPHSFREAVESLLIHCRAPYSSLFVEKMANLVRTGMLQGCLYFNENYNSRLAFHIHTFLGHAVRTYLPSAPPQNVVFTFQVIAEGLQCDWPPDPTFAVDDDIEDDDDDDIEDDTGEEDNDCMMSDECGSSESWFDGREDPKDGFSVSEGSDTIMNCFDTFAINGHT